MTGAEVRATRESAHIERSEIATAMGVHRQRIVNIEGQATLTDAAATRYRKALETVLLDRLASDLASLQAMDYQPDLTDPEVRSRVLDGLEDASRVAWLGRVRQS